jgi:hypothetical protein
VNLSWGGQGGPSGSASVYFQNMQQTVLNDVSGPTTTEHIMNEPGPATQLTINGQAFNDIIIPVISPTQPALVKITGHRAGTINNNVAFSGVYYILIVGRGTGTFQFYPGGFLDSLDYEYQYGGTGVMDLSQYGSSVTVNLPVSYKQASPGGTVPGLCAAFLGISQIIGAGPAASGSVSDTLTGPAAANTWSLTGTNSGQMGGVTFSGFTNLTGGSQADTFQFASGGSETGTVDGGGGTNTFDYSAYNGTVKVVLPLGKATGTGGVKNVQNVTGGNGNNLLVGDANTNVLIGGTGRNILIGGAGSDVLDASRATSDNILIGGTTSFDGTASYQAALDAIFAEWTRTDLNFSSRYSDLVDGTGSTNPLNTVNGQLILLNNQTVLGDGAADTMTGTTAIDPSTGKRAHDWFFVDPQDPALTTYDPSSDRRAKVK